MPCTTARRMLESPSVTMITEMIADHRAQDEALHGEPEQHGESDRQGERPDERDVPCVDHGEEEVAAKEQEFALREVEDAARLVDDDEAERDQSVDAPDDEPVERELEEEFHQPARSSRTARSALMRAVLPSWKRMVVSTEMRSASP